MIQNSVLRAAAEIGRRGSRTVKALEMRRKARAQALPYPAARAGDRCAPHRRDEQEEVMNDQLEGCSEKEGGRTSDARTEAKLRQAAKWRTGGIAALMMGVGAAMHTALFDEAWHATVAATLLAGWFGAHLVAAVLTAQAGYVWVPGVRRWSARAAIGHERGSRNLLAFEAEPKHARRILGAALGASAAGLALAAWIALS